MPPSPPSSIRSRLPSKAAHGHEAGNSERKPQNKAYEGSGHRRNIGENHVETGKISGPYALEERLPVFEKHLHIVFAQRRRAGSRTGGRSQAVHHIK